MAGGNSHGLGFVNVLERKGRSLVHVEPGEAEIGFRAEEEGGGQAGCVVNVSELLLLACPSLFLLEPFLSLT